MFPHETGSGWEIDAPAKLNLYLDVLGSRADGFHELETLMVPVRVYDQLSWVDSRNQKSKSHLLTRSLPNLRCASAPSVTNGPENLVCRAAERLAQVAGIEPHGTFRLTKRIPMQAGLGGGSSNAAAALLLANAAWGIGYSRQRLAELAADVGSDVPFFLHSGAAVCRGRGEIVEPISALPRMHFVVVKPPTCLSTAEVFSQWDQRRENSLKGVRSTDGGLGTLIGLLRSGALAQAGRKMLNRLESVAETISPWIDRLRYELSKHGFCGQLMTGSGSAFFGLARSATQARRAARLLAGKDLGNIVATSSC